MYSNTEQDTVPYGGKKESIIFKALNMIHNGLKVLGQNLKNAKIKEVKRINSEFNLEDSIINSYKQRISKLIGPNILQKKFLEEDSKMKVLNHMLQKF